MRNINRPISPHLTIYNPQKASIFSIWHRISGVIMFVLIISPFFLLHSIYFSHMTIFLAHFLVHYVVSDWFLFSCKLFVISIFLYHISNGIRHLLWDVVIHVNTINMYKDSNILLFLAFIIIIAQFCVSF
uniref:Succinate:cytochrome c oxidoreductase subunit 3 n=1 Tax=Pyropia nitida TaxID=1682381 RepID=A0A0U2E4A9_9RHOD|nr:succinate:cytochrome c oxidoreductase subunit 3 [Pyropia nitida]AKQ53250.1 succinate:cytochrome c oxidoreductase subunit 3 [Pyropia nitida]